MDPLSAAAHAAVERDDVVELTKYLDDGVSVDSVDIGNYDDWSLLHKAAWCGSTKCLSILLDRNANVNGTCYEGWTVLHYASGNGQIEALTLLLDRTDLNIDAVNHCGRTPLHYAVQDGYIDCVQLILDRGANREIVDGLGYKLIDLYGELNNRKIADEIRQLLIGGGRATKAAKPRF